MIKRCDKCNKNLQYLDNEENDFTFLICPKCNKIYDAEKCITVDERRREGYSRYQRKEEKRAFYIREHYIENNEDER